MIWFLHDPNKASKPNIRIKFAKTVLFPLISLWNKRVLILHFSLMTTKVRYLGTYIGFLWAVLEPLMAFVILYIVFSSMRGNSDPNYPIYLLIGVLFFQIFSRGTQMGLASLRGNAGILKSINISKEFFPVVSTGSTGIVMIVQILVFFALMPVFNYTPPLTVILLIIPMIMLLILVLGLSYILSILFVFIKDVQNGWSIFSYAMFFVTPIFWYVDEIEGVLLNIQQINPLGQIMEIAHKVIFGEIPPIGDWLYSAFLVLAIFFAGYFIFHKLENKIVEEL